MIELDLSDNAFGPDGVIAVSFLVEASPQLKVLKLNNNGLGSLGGLYLAQSLLLCESMNLHIFSAGRNRLEDAGTRDLAEVSKADLAEPERHP
jgi:Ran GTPase-activating protein 1